MTRSATKPEPSRQPEHKTPSAPAPEGAEANDEGPLESLGRAISETVTGSVPDKVVPDTGLPSGSPPARKP